MSLISGRCACSFSSDETAVRFTQSRGYVYPIVLAPPVGNAVVLDDLRPNAGTEIRLLGYGVPLRWQQRGAQIVVELPGDMPTGPAYALRFSQGPA